nr:glycosyltransferase [Paenibacillus xylanexedens]
MKNVILVTDATIMGGLGTYLLEVAQFARNQGYNLLILMDNNQSTIPLYNNLVNLGIRVIREKLYRSSATYKEIYQVVQDVVTSFTPDLMHVFLGSPRSAIIPRKVALDLNVPLLFTEALVSNKLIIDKEQLKEIKFFYKKAYKVFVLSQDNFSILENHYKLSMDNVIRISNFVEVNKSVAKKSFPKPKYKAVTVARLSEQKGIDILIHAISKLPDQLKSVIDFSIYGDGEKKDDYIQLSKKLNVEHLIHFLGWKENILKVLSNYDLFILPSRFEGQPHSLLEALSFHLPSIATNVSGVPEILNNGEYGYIVDSENSDELMQAIKLFLDDPRKLAEKAASSQIHLEKNHDKEINISMIMKHWAEARSE